MKKLLLAVMLVLVAVPCFAIDLPDVKTGAVLDLEEGKLTSVTSLTLLKYKVPKVGIVTNLDVGYGIENKGYAGISLEVGSLADIDGIDFPLAGLVDISVGVGALVDFNSADDAEDFDITPAVYATILKYEF